MFPQSAKPAAVPSPHHKKTAIRNKLMEMLATGSSGPQPPVMQQGTPMMAMGNEK